MSTPSLKPRLHFVEAFLLRREWTLAEEGERYRTFAAPAKLGLGDGARLTLPAAADAPDSDLTLQRIRDVLVDVYELASERLTPLLSSGGVVTSLQMESELYNEGTIPFPQFEATIEKLKKTLLDAATFVLTDEPNVSRVLPEAQQYLRACRFLQTEVGSFVANVQLPEGKRLASETLLRKEPVHSDDVNARLPAIVEYVVGPIFDAQQSAFSPAGLEASLDVVNLAVMKDVGDLLQSTGASQVNLSFTDAGGERVIRSGELSTVKFERLKSYLSFARTRLGAEFPIDITGRVTLLRSSGAGKGRNWVGVTGIHDGRQAYATFSMNKKDHVYAINAYKSGRLVRVRGSARRMRTQLRINTLQYFEELGAHT